jgi:hypothetical protein
LKAKLTILILSLLLLGCKKGRICECSTTWTYNYSNGSGQDTRIFPSDSKPYDKGLTKRQAIDACDHQKETIETSFKDLITNHGKDPLQAGEKIETECILH